MAEWAEGGKVVEGTKPILFNIDEDKRKMKEALKHCRKHLGDNVTILFDYGLPESIKDMVKEQGKCAGGPWDCYSVGAFYGWEAERVVAVTTGWRFIIVELAMRAKTDSVKEKKEDSTGKYRVIFLTGPPLDLLSVGR